jgi:signal transduction histidine kinase|nr:ATP-binding protein [Candidatus Krumholzibacteria bacterium]
MISLEVLYSLIEENYVFLMVCDQEEQLRYCSQDLKKNLGLPLSFAMESTLEDILDPSSLISFRQAIESVDQDNSGVNALLTSKTRTATSLPLHVRMVEIPDDRLYLFFGAQIDTLNKISDWERDERVKELSCLYGVAEWIESSPSLEEFFTRLPKYLAPGMRFPEEVVVYSTYNETSYGQKPATGDYIVTFLMVNGALKGEIRIGYLRDSHKLLPEEQRMLSEIGRILSLAMERKELSIGVALKEEEEAEFQRKLAQLDQQISAREGELEAQQLKLSTVDNYLSRISSNWEKASRRMETMFQAIPDPVMLIDPDYNIVMSNQDKVAAGQKCYAAFFQRESPCPDCRLDQALKNKSPVTSNMRHEDRHLQLHTLPVFNEQHAVDGVMEFIRDVTLEKTYEQQIQQADKLASLGQLVSGIGHEINNPNQFIRGNVKIVRQAFEDLLPIVDAYYQDHPDLKIAKLKYSFFKEHIMTLVDDMAHGSERIKGIVDGLRSFARKDEGLLIDVVDVNTLLGTTTRLVQNEVHKRATIELDLSPDLPTFTGNSQKIEQVLINLIVNAAQAIPDDVRGEVRVSTRFAGGQVVIRVQDNGKGMDAKTRKQIFDPFFTTKRTKGGTGLGLAICFRIIEEHGGTIAVTSELNQGTTFTVSLPAHKAEAKTAEKS